MKSTVFFTEKDILENIKSIIKGGKEMRRKGKQILAAATAAALLLSGCGAAVRFGGEDDRCGDTQKGYSDRGHAERYTDRSG